MGHPYRVAILRRFLATGTTTPTNIAAQLDLPLGTVSHHIRLLESRRIIKLAGRTQRRGAYMHHYQLTDRDRAASILWGVRAALLVTDVERDRGRSDTTVTLDPQALAELRALTDGYLARLGELGLQTRERHRPDGTHGMQLTQVAVLLATESIDPSR